MRNPPLGFRFRRIEPMPQGSLPRPLNALARLRPGALPAVKATAPVRHCRLLTGTAVVPSACAAPRGDRQPFSQRGDMGCSGHFRTILKSLGPEAEPGLFIGCLTFLCGPQQGELLTPP
jgi:hypothetical protein